MKTRQLTSNFKMLPFLKKRLFLLLIFAFQVSYLSAQFVTPIEGKYGKDYIIVNYLDHNKSSGIKDHKCGTKTYNGHQGTDFVISGFPQMDKGVNVLAAARGKVFRVINGRFDRETRSTPSKKLGNYIEIYHAATNTWTYYAHLKKNSMRVKPGDNVVAGQRIAKVGSSGNSADPHLHFELWHNKGSVIDPFRGSCGTSKNYWNNPVSYETSYHTWKTGFLNVYPNLTKVKNRTGAKTHFTSRDNYIAFWLLQYGIKKGDKTRLDWIDPNGRVHSSKTKTYNKDNWFNYYYTYIFKPPTSKQGKWTCKFYYNGRLKSTKTFTYGSGQSSDTMTPSAPSNLRANNITQTSTKLTWNASSDNVRVTGYDVYRGSTKIKTVTGTNASITGLRANTSYSFKVKAKDAAGNTSGYSNTRSIKTLATSAGGGRSSCLSGPQNVKTSTISSTSKKVTWNNVSGASYYLIKYKPTGSLIWKYAYDFQHANQKTLTSLSRNTSYQAVISNYCAGSGWSSANSFRFGTGSAARKGNLDNEDVNELETNYQTLNPNRLVYPNPTSGNITIALPIERKGWSYQLTTISGQVVQTGRISNPISTLNLNELDKGLYFLQLTSDQQREIHRVVKQ